MGKNILIFQNKQNICLKLPMLLNKPFLNIHKNNPKNNCSFYDKFVYLVNLSKVL